MKRLSIAVLALLVSGVALLVLLLATSDGSDPMPAAAPPAPGESDEPLAVPERTTTADGGDSTGITSGSAVWGSPTAPTTPSVVPSTATAAGNPATVPAAVAGPALDLTEAPTAPRLVPEPADYTDPLSVSRAYLAAWCHQRLDGPANQNVADAAAWATRLGFEFDSSTALTDQAWQDLVDGGLTPTCGPVTAVVSPDAPVGDNWVWVQMTTRRAWTDDSGRIIGQDTVSRTRRVVQASDGRWLVDAQVQAG